MNNTIAKVTIPRERHSSPSDRNRGVISNRARIDFDIVGLFLEKGEFGLDTEDHPSL